MAKHTVFLLLDTYVCRVYRALILAAFTIKLFPHMGGVAGVKIGHLSAIEFIMKLQVFCVCL